MKWERRKVERDELVYIAMDGKEFDNKWDCAEYEKNFYAESYEALMDLPKCTICGESWHDLFYNVAGDDTIFVIMLDSEETIEKVNRFMRDRNSREFGKRDIGSIQMIGMWSDGTQAFSMGTVENFKKAFCEALDEAADKAMRARLTYNNELLKANEKKEDK